MPRHSDSRSSRRLARRGTVFFATALLGLCTAGAAPAGESTGACCYGIDQCVQDTLTACTDKYTGTYEGDFTVCGDPGICGTALCGNEIVEAPEECDDGNTVSGDGCSELCVYEFCGDGTVNNGATAGLPRGARIVLVEQCDDGNNISGDGCDEFCQKEYCGDFIVQAGIGEQCDDGNTVSGDGCSENCIDEFGACCHGSLCDDGLTAETCTSTYSGSFAGIGTSCGDPGVCVNCGDSTVQAGEECDDGGTTAGDGCDDTCAIEQCWTCDNGAGPVFGPSSCSEDNLAACDDGDDCTFNDACDSGLCTGDPPIVPAACDWVMVAGAPSGRPAQARARGASNVFGDLCGQTTLVGDAVVVTGDVVATASSGRGSRIRAQAQVIGDVITGGASILGQPVGTPLPDLDTDEVPGGTATTQLGDPTRDYDATGSSTLATTRVGECQNAIDSIAQSATDLDALSPTDAISGKLKVGRNQSLVLDATGPLNVIDFDQILTGNKATITLNGNSIPDVVFVLRVDGKFFLKLGSTLELTDGATPERVIIYGHGLCKIGQFITGAGTVFCPNSRVKVDQYSTWNGALVSGRQSVHLRRQVGLTHVPLVVGAP